MSRDMYMMYIPATVAAAAAVVVVSAAVVQMKLRQRHAFAAVSEQRLAWSGWC